MPDPPDDYYTLLGVPVAVDDETLRKAWRQLALRWHPDRVGAGATATFQQLAAAYAVLSDPLARAAYDRRRRAREPPISTPRPDPPPPAPAPAPTRRQAPGTQLSRLSGPLASLLACGAARRDEPGYITLMVRDDEASTGGMVTISMPIDLWCPQCTGQPPTPQCPRCHGSGTVRELFAAWLAIPPGVTDGDELAPTVSLPGMVAPVRFRVRIRPRK